MFQFGFTLQTSSSNRSVIMDIRKLFPILVIFLTFYLNLVSSKKAIPSHEIQGTSEESQVETVSRELQDLKSPRNDNGTSFVVKPKPKKKTKHHQRGSHNRRVQLRGRVHKKKRTNPTDILIAEDDLMPTNNRTKTSRSGKNKNASTKIKPNNRSRESRHLDFLDDEREFTNGHSSSNIHKHHHKHHRLGRRRLHHKKHKKATTPVNEQKPLESPTLQDTSIINP